MAHFSVEITRRSGSVLGGNQQGGRYKKVSMAFFSPSQGHNPVPGTWYPKHVGFLGAAAPAVSGLKPVKFSAEAPAGAVFTAAFGERGFEETASILQTLREFFIEKWGMEDADKALPPWRIEWLSRAELSGRSALGGAYAADPSPDTQPKPKEEEPAVTQQPDPAFAAREADLQAREAAIAEREKEATHQGHVAFAEKLVTDGKLLPASKDKVVAILDALPAQKSVSFAEGAEQLTPAAAIREVLEAQPKVVSFGRADLPEGGGSEQSAAFAADGKPVDPAGLAIHQKAQEYQRQNPGTAYLDAVRAVS